MDEGKCEKNRIPVGKPRKVLVVAEQRDIKLEGLVVGRNRREGKHSLKKFVGVAKVACKIVQAKFFGKKLSVFGSADIVNSCNLKCKHCYWWLNRKPREELSADEWRTIVREKFIKNDVLSISLTGGEPLLRQRLLRPLSAR
ncbi:radical SAM protein [Candidatus Bathyarchaeota archaeon A05DMB-3]|jgi:sulfatase maturation enzyme AslB (radical SAM superfamily)|nr:radical SAM protein [Candidatus Bathyarchaeota archaeon A05DMB-3]